MERRNLAPKITTAHLKAAEIKRRLKAGAEAIPNPPQGKGPNPSRKDVPAIEEQETQGANLALCPPEQPGDMVESSQPRLDFGGHYNYDFVSCHRSSSPKKRKIGGGSTSVSQSFAELSEEDRHSLASDAMGSLYRTGDRTRFVQANKEEEYKAMQLAWAEFSIRAAAFAENGISVQSLITERDESHATVDGLREELKGAKDELEKLRADHQQHKLEKEDWENRRRRYKTEGKEAKAALEEVKAELHRTTQKLSEAESQLQASQFEMAQAWLNTDEGVSHLAGECLEASRIVEDESLERMKNALSLMWPDYDFGSTFERYNQLRDEELAQIMSEGAHISGD